MKQARELNGRFRKLEEIDDTVVQRGRRRAARSITTTEDSAMKGNIDSILNSKRRRAGYEPTEINAMEEAVMGSSAERALRQAGRLAPGGGASWLGLATPPIMGYMAKKGAGRMAAKSIDDMVDLIAAGGKRVPKARVITPSQKEDLARMFTLMGIKEY